MENRNEEPTFEGGSQPVPDHPPEVPSGGRSVMQTVVVIVGVLVLLAAALWLLVPLGSS